MNRIRPRVIAMRLNTLKLVLTKSGLAASLLLLAGGAALAQSVSLTAGPSTATLPDGTAVPMWGYTCTNAAVAPATCAALNTHTSGWSPVVITVPPGPLTINLTNSLPASIVPLPTSLVIVGQLSVGLGTTGPSTPSPDHPNAQPFTWPIAADPPINPAGPVVPPLTG